MRFKTFFEANWSDEFAGFAGMLEWTSRQQWERNRDLVMAFTDYLEDHGYQRHANLIRCTLEGHFPQKQGHSWTNVNPSGANTPEPCNAQILQQTIDEIESFNFVGMRRLETPEYRNWQSNWRSRRTGRSSPPPTRSRLLLSLNGKNIVYDSQYPDPRTGQRRRAFMLGDEEVTHLSDDQRTMVMHAVLKRFVWFFLVSGQRQHQWNQQKKAQWFNRRDQARGQQQRYDDNV